MPAKKHRRRGRRHHADGHRLRAGLHDDQDPGETQHAGQHLPPGQALGPETARQRPSVQSGEVNSSAKTSASGATVMAKNHRFLPGEMREVAKEMHPPMLPLW